MPTKHKTSSSANETTPKPAAKPDVPSSPGEQSKSKVEEQNTSAALAKTDAESSAPRSWVCLCGDPNCIIFHGVNGAGARAGAAPDAEPATQVPAQLASMAVCAAQLDDETGVSLNLTLDAGANGKGPTLLLRRQGTSKMEAEAPSQESAGAKPPAEGAKAPAPAPAAQLLPPGPHGARS